MVCEKGRFSASERPINKEKFLIKPTAAQTSHRTKANEQSHILSSKTYCKLAVHLLLFEKTSVLRLHYDNPFAPIQSLFAGVLQAKPVSARAAGNFCKVSSGRALNRGRRASPRVLFGYFLHDAKSDNSFPFAGSFEVLQTSIQLTILQLRINKIKSFHRLAAAFSCFLQSTKSRK